MLSFRYNKDIAICINIMDNMVSDICFKMIQDENKWVGIQKKQDWP